MSGQSSAAAPTILRTTNSGDNWISEFPEPDISSIQFILLIKEMDGQQVKTELSNQQPTEELTG
ncbi:MAG: hypothetical protein IPI04_03015 [Ignavibacteria bacterium]|nr:hypothetical protein [Ignavibacteria bacterium]